MSLVAYPLSSSEEETDEQAVRSLKRKRGLAPQQVQAASHGGPAHMPKPAPPRATAASTALPALPPSFHDLYASAARISTHDDPSLHGGRTRSVPHVDGQWPSHVYLEWLPSPSQTAHIDALIAKVGGVVTSLTTSPLGVPLPLHISLSAPLSLATAQRNPFMAALKRCVGRSMPGMLRPFEIGICGWKWVANWEGTRWFLVLKVARPKGDELNRLLGACNEAAGGFGLGKLYTGRGQLEGDWTDFFHFSVAWSLVPPGHEETHGELIYGEVWRAVESINVSMDALKVKIGDVVISILMDRQDNDNRGLVA